jgi:hypothetical protein
MCTYERNVGQISFYRELDDEIPEEDLCSTEKCETPNGLDSDGWDPALGFSKNLKGRKKVAMLKSLVNSFEDLRTINLCLYS